jgi:hypothetical protein
MRENQCETLPLLLTIWIANEQTGRRRINDHDQRPSLINLGLNSV